ncbi:hypothetical protein G6F50_016955 [Rhizopus delemar]|uniref:Uncharacterized protein n=1 Tax=Rhizopus delemar TaxID=936053 RepID=A0A9P7C0W7_9FUNG|nr:hypothetical protein G6F50_016955 [Rhizopus delemar]
MGDVAVQQPGVDQCTAGIQTRQPDAADLAGGRIGDVAGMDADVGAGQLAAVIQIALHGQAERAVGYHLTTVACRHRRSRGYGGSAACRPPACRHC